MPTAEKAKAIEETRDWYAKSKGLVFADYRGLKVKEMQALRKAIRAKGGELHVLKNTLFRIAAGEDAAKLPDELHNGPTAITFIFENESAVAKSIFDYAQTNKSLQVKGGFFNGAVFDAKGVERLSKLPPRDILLAQLIGTIAAPLSNLVGVIEALYADPIRVIGAVADKVAGPAAAPEPAAPAQPAAEEVTETSAEIAEASPEPVAEEATPEAPAEEVTETAAEVAVASGEATPAEPVAEAAEEVAAETTAAKETDSPAEESAATESSE